MEKDNRMKNPANAIKRYNVDILDGWRSEREYTGTKRCRISIDSNDYSKDGWPEETNEKGYFMG